MYNTPAPYNPISRKAQPMHDWILSTEGSDADRVFVRQQLRAYNCEQLPGFFDMGPGGSFGTQFIDEPFWFTVFEITIGQHGVLTLTDAGDADLPITGLTWSAMRDFCEVLGGRVPTETEWEYVARGPQNRLYPWGDSPVPDSSRVATDRLMPVGSFPESASWVGVQDLLGNARETTTTIYYNVSATVDYVPTEAFEEEVLPDVQRVIRGGSFNSSINPLSNLLREGYGGQDETIGFRCMVPYNATPADAISD
ncbi:formylglycine-generating enzyme family protein [bacterium]|nr:formylglycine-generating enzyme family protein [bacterium]